MGMIAVRVRIIGLGLVLILSRVVLAQVEPTDSPTPSTADTAQLEEIVVTGTHIRGMEAAGTKVIVISREQIDASGYGRIEDVLSTVTQNFNQVNAATPYSNFDNLNRGSEVQLRGLGVGTTLTLVNGQRQGASGEQGLFTDVSSIPASAVERIEILPDAAAALYGSDAVGGVVNIILRRDFSGLEARVRASTAGGDAREWTLAMLWGQAGPDGHLMAGFQIDDSEALTCGARHYCAANGDYRGFGGSDLRSVGGNPGTVLDPVTLAPIAAIPHGQDGTQLTAAQLIPGAVNYTNSVSDNDIVPKQTMRSGFASASRRITDQWQWSVDGRYSSREFNLKYPQGAVPLYVPANNAFNHLGGSVLVGYDLTPDLGPVVDSGPEKTFFLGTGIKGTLQGGWLLNLTGSYSKASTEFIEANTLNMDAIDAALNNTDPAAALNVFGDGTHTNPVALARLRSQNVTSSYSDVFSTTAVSVIADGPLIAEAAGSIRAAVGADYRKEHSDGFNIAGRPENRLRQVYAGFFELAVPLIAARSGAIAHRLDLSLAGRYDRYSDAGTIFNPTLGFRARPNPQLTLRGTWGTAFRAPPFFYSNPDQVGDAAISDVVDPQSPSGYSRALLLFGPVPNQKPETARSWTLGVDLTPPAQNFSLSLTYFDIDYRGKIRSPGPLAAAFLTQEAEFSSVITRNPTQAQIDAVCTKPPYGGSCDQPIAVILDNRARNLARVETRGVDIVLDYFNDTAKGKWAYGLDGTYMLVQQQQITPSASLVNVVDTVGNPLELRLIARMSWSHNGWTIQARGNYSGRYRDPISVPSRYVEAWSTVDLNLGYDTHGDHGWLAHMQINLGIINLFDQQPPFVDQFDVPTGTLGYDPANANIMGRQVSLQFVKSWGK